MAVIPAITTTALSPQVGSQAIATSAVNAVLPVALPLVLKAAPEPQSVNQKNPAGYPTG